ncbi:MAG: DNA-protecting protein DprA [Clostridia bacterium]|nr:DNA-protecting protein DprA [Clostridia bacterium]
MTSLNRNAIILLDGFLNFEYKHKVKIIELYENVGEIFSNLQPAITYLNSVDCGLTSNALITAINNNYVNTLLESYNNSGVSVVTIYDSNYPKRLLDLPFNPLCIYAKGNLELLNAKNTLSIVGSRKTLTEYAKMTANFSNTFSKSGVVIITGVAPGGDTAVINGALESGNVICVLASGFNYLDIEANRELINKVVKKGLLISEYPLDVAPRNFRYPVRNRIIAGLGDGVLIVSGTLTSGTRHTASYALDYGKDVFCFPYSPTYEGGKLCNSLIKDGAVLVTNEEDISQVLRFETKVNNIIDLTEREEQVYNVIKNGVTKVDDICAELDVKIFALMPIISSLEIKGVITKGTASEYLPIK